MNKISTPVPSVTMIDTLQALIVQEVYNDLRTHIGWNSLIVNRRKPWTYRVYRQYDDIRICLHAFDPCSSDESFRHPHPWPGAFLLLKGSYVHTTGFAPDLEQEPTKWYREILGPHSMYEITDRTQFHSVQPLCRTYTIMANGPAWDSPHSMTRRTKGKDLDKMNPSELQEHLDEFQSLLGDYLEI